LKPSGNVLLWTTGDQDLERRELIDMERQGSQDLGRGPIVFTFVEGIDNNYTGRERLSGREERVYDELFELVRQVRIACDSMTRATSLPNDG
jgi:hypothetical protein